jgi:polysaccharide pyruvyl transferase WcaK-like protein
MKICILTQPLGKNYGGIMQAFALQKVLKDMGHDVFTLDLPLRKNLYWKTKNFAWRVFSKLVLRKKHISIFHSQPNEKEKHIIQQHTLSFVKDNIVLTEHIPTPQKIGKLKKYNFEAYIVGSDQVWRPRYSPGITTFFLSFVQNIENIKRIAYAASFGVDEWEFPSGLTTKCKKLIEKFDAVSVREKSGIKLCNNYLDVTAEFVLDPTLLLERKDYVTLIEKNPMPTNENSLMVYVLDKTPFKKSVIEKVQQILGLEINSVMAEKKFYYKDYKDIEQCVLPPVEKWLRGFLDAEFIVTDSFHGTVLAIIFNKPFITIGNKGRGLARFYSILEVFNLQNRFVMEEDNINIESIITSLIDYDKVNNILDLERNRSFEFLISALNEKNK